MKPAILAGSMALPVAGVDLASVIRDQTHSYLRMGEAEPDIVEAFRMDGEYIHVPRQYGLALCRRLGLEYVDRTSEGVAVTFPTLPTPRDEQVPVLDEIMEVAGDFYDFLFRARTGFGKTLCSLLIAARRGRATLIVVDQDNLKDQWIESLVKHFGFSVADVGIIQGKKCVYEGKAVTIAMMQTLSQKEFPPEVYNYFGTMFVDEVHIAGAPTFSVVLMDFSATVRIGPSATPKRKDGLQKLLEDNLGKVRVYVGDAHDKSSVLVVEHPTVYSWYANTSPKIGRFLTEISEDGSRNLLAAETIQMLYDTGRDLLIIGDRIEQLQHVMNLCYFLGIPEGEMGMYTGQDFRFAFEKDPTPPRRPTGHTRGTEYTPVSLKLISKKIPKARLKLVKETARIIFATSGMFSKGVDEPRLSGGMDLTPRASSEQTHGRTLRKVAGKRIPIWVTVADTSSYRALFQLIGRLSDYKRNNAAIFKLNDDGSTEPCHLPSLRRDLFDEVERLKSLRIGPNNVGLNTLLSQESQKQNALKAVSAIRRRQQGPQSSPTVSSRRVPYVKSTTKTSTTPQPSSPSPYPRRRVR